MERSSMIFYRSFFEAIQGLEEAHQAQVYNAVFAYSFNGREPELQGVPKTVFTLIKPQLDANNKRYLNGQKYGHLGAAHGKKGGKKRVKLTPSEPSTIPPPNPQSNPQQTLNHTLNKPSNVNVNENENVNNTNSSNLSTNFDERKAFEYLRRAASVFIPDDFIKQQVGMMKNEYGDKKIGNLSALCNRWASNMKYEKPQTNTVPLTKI